MQSIGDFLEILQCPNCRSEELRVCQADAPISLRDIILSGQEIRCGQCKERYPITDDGIPILWTPEIRAYLGFDPNSAPASDAISANMEVYDKTSDHYLEHVRKGDGARGRFMACVAKVDSDLSRDFPDGGWHVDFGCGPGHVLIWTQDWAASRGIRQVGLDVSIQNLRNVRAETNAFVVLGDAVRMPFKSGIAALVTEASVLHHIENWPESVTETCRVTHPKGKVIYDNEPTKDGLNWSPLAKAIFEMRFVGYKGLSYFVKSKRNFRNMKLAQLNYYQAEVHNQPGRGFDPDQVARAFSDSGRECDLYFKAGDDLRTGSGKNSMQLDFLLFLSTRDWRNPKRGVLTLIAS